MSTGFRIGLTLACDSIIIPFFILQIPNINGIITSGDDNGSIRPFPTSFGPFGWNLEYNFHNLPLRVPPPGALKVPRNTPEFKRKERKDESEAGGMRRDVMGRSDALVPRLDFSLSPYS